MKKSSQLVKCPVCLEDVRYEHEVMCFVCTVTYRDKFDIEDSEDRD